MWHHEDSAKETDGRNGKVNVNRVDHICIAVRDLDTARPAWEGLLGKSAPDSSYRDDEAKVQAVIYMVGETGIELMQDTTGDGATARFVETRGEGIMHIALNVPNTADALGELKAAGTRVIADPEGKVLVSPAGVNYIFVHPKGTNGVTVEVLDTEVG